MIQTRVKNIYCAQPQTIDDGKRKEYFSSYMKSVLNQQEFLLNELGFVDDTQSDKENHGGVDKAVCIYSQKYYDYFTSEHNITLPESAFGENLTILDLDDTQVCIGDKFRFGEVLLEVSQPRQPCWKISSISQIKNLTSLLVKESKTGFYVRVLEEGSVTKADTLELISREYPAYTIEFVNKCSFDTKNNQENIEELLECPKLSDAFKESLQKRLRNKEQGLQEWQKDN